MYKVVSNSGAVWTVAPVTREYAEKILARLRATFRNASKTRFNFRIVEAV